MHKRPGPAGYRIRALFAAEQVYPGQPTEGNCRRRWLWIFWRSAHIENHGADPAAAAPHYIQPSHRNSALNNPIVSSTATNGKAKKQSTVATASVLLETPKKAEKNTKTSKLTASWAQAKVTFMRSNRR